MMILTHSRSSIHAVRIIRMRYDNQLNTRIKLTGERKKDRNAKLVRFRSSYYACKIYLLANTQRVNVAIRYSPSEESVWVFPSHSSS